MNPGDVTIRPIAGEEEFPRALLLDADPAWEIVEQYLNREWVFMCCYDDIIIGIYVLFPLDETTIELKNIAVSEAFQNKGIGTLMLRNAVDRVRSLGYHRMIVCTGNASIGPLYLYQREGFILTDVRWNYVTEHYPEPMYDDGILVRHMLVLSQDLWPNRRVRT
jgi:aminoglycoside 6'-N-acetyltransferase I